MRHRNVKRRKDYIAILRMCSGSKEDESNTGGKKNLALKIHECGSKS